MKVFGLAGWSGAGKTTLMVRLVPELVRRGVRVATIKHTHHNPAVGTPETAALAAAGAVETLVAAPERFALVHELDGADEPALADLIGSVRGVDLLLVEGFKFAGHPKIEIRDPALGKPALAEGDSSVVAVACDQPTDVHGRPLFRRDDVAGIAAFITAYCGLA